MRCWNLQLALFRVETGWSSGDNAASDPFAEAEAEAVQIERRFANVLQQKITKVIKVSGTLTSVPDLTQDAAVASEEDFLTLSFIHSAGCLDIPKVVENPKACCRPRTVLMCGAKAGESWPQCGLLLNDEDEATGRAGCWMRKNLFRLSAKGP